MSATVEIEYSAYPDYINLDSHDFEARFYGKGHVTKHYPGIGDDIIPSKFKGEVGINPDGKTPFFWIELSSPEETRLSRDATLADAISFSEVGLLQSLIARNVNNMLSKSEEYGRS